MAEQHPAAPGQPADHPEAVASVQHEGAAAHEAPNFMGFEAPWFIALAIVAVFAILAWKRVPAAIAKALDSKIALIREQLAEAETLRKEAEALKAEYAKKAKSADKDRDALLERARHEADEIVAKAKTDADALIKRRTRMAEEKIAAEERHAIEQLRSTTAEVASKAAARLIAERHDAKTDEKLVNQAIGEIAR